jgi:hypothetical protein
MFTIVEGDKVEIIKSIAGYVDACTQLAKCKNSVILQSAK